MIRFRAALVLGFVFVTGLGISVRADVRADEKTQLHLPGMLGKVVGIFGGKAAREGTTSVTAVKGDRKATLKDTTGQIIDLTEEKVYDYDLKKKTYKVTTFAEMRQRMEEAQQKAQQARRDQPATPAEPAQKDPNAKEMEVELSVKNTGEKKTINGFDTHQTIVTITMHEKGKKLEESGGMMVTSDMWLAPAIAAMKEIAEFDRRYAAKLAGPVIAGASAEEMASVMAMYPMIRPALGRMNAENAKVEGTAILTTVSVDAVPSAEQAAQNAKQGGNNEKQPDNPLGGLLSGFGKKGQKKNSDQPPQDSQQNGRTNVMTSTREVLKVVTSVDASDVAIPAGFKENK